MRLLALFVLLFVPAGTLPALIDCTCESQDPKIAEARQCSLCREADKQDPALTYFFLKDINPTKPNRWLILPRMHQPGLHDFDEAPLALRTAVWTAGIERGRSQWGDDWGLAYNGRRVRTQCHTHIHIGKLLPNVETNNFVVVDGPAQIPMIHEDGIWVHQVNGKLHVHQGEQKAELVLMR